MITPNRRTVLQLDIGEYCLERGTWNLRRELGDLGKPRPQGAPASSGVVQLPGGAWALEHLQGELAQIVHADYEDAVIGPGDVETAPGIESAPSFGGGVQGGMLPGIGAAADLVVSGANVFLKRVAAGGLWDAVVLAADALAFPGPNEPISSAYPLDRVIAGKVQYGENSGFGLVFDPIPGIYGSDTFLRFYFGGSAAVSPQAAKGGQFCLSVGGSGKATLRERNSDGEWEQRYKFEWSDAQRAADEEHLISLIPHGTNRLAFLSKKTGDVVEALRLTLPAFGTPKHPSFWQDLPSQTHHTHRRSLTGQGIIRLDIRRDYRGRVLMVRNKHPLQGIHTESAFVISRDLPAGTPITLTLDKYLGPNTTITAALYDASTHAALAKDLQGRFLSVAGQRAYYPRFTLATTDRYQTPVLYGFTVDVPLEYRIETSIPQVFPTGLYGSIQGVQIQGAGTTPETESASLAIKDPEDELPLLRVRGDIRSLISVVDTTSGAVISHLFEGRTVRSPAKLRGKPQFDGYPSPNWRDYPCLRMIGLWQQLAETFSTSLWDLSQDPNAPIDPNTGQQMALPRKVTDILRILFHNAGVPDDELDIPNLPVRLHLSEAGFSAQDATVQYGTDFSALIQALVRDYLGLLIVRDPNAGARGMWRVLRNPTRPYSNFLATFYTSEPPFAAGLIQTAGGAYGASGTWIQEDTWNTYVIPPEVNDLTVYGVRGQDSAGAGLITQHMRNEASISGPRLSPEYRGRVVPYSHGPDPALQTQAAADAFIRRVYNRAAHAEKWFEFRAPLMLVWDPLDPYQTLYRPLRINDLVYIWDAGTTHPAVVFGCEPDYDLSDEMQMANYEGMFLIDHPEGELEIR